MTMSDVAIAIGSSVSSYQHAITHFRSPIFPSKPLVPFSYQIDICNYVDYGYDMRAPPNPLDPNGMPFKPLVNPNVILMKSRRQIGKTEGISFLNSSLAANHENTSCGIISIKEKRAKEVLKKCKWYFEHSDLDWMVEESYVDELHLSNGSMIQSNPKSGNIRGATYTWLTIDECGYIEDDIIDEAAIPTVSMAGRFLHYGKPDIILTSTPPPSNNCKFHEYYVRGLENRELGCLTCGYRAYITDKVFENIRFYERNYVGNIACPQCKTINNFIFISNEVVCICPDPWVHPYKSKADIQRELDQKGNTPGAKREVLGEWATDDAGVFLREWLEMCVDTHLFNDTKVIANTRYVLGIDYGLAKDATVFCVGHLNEDAHTVMDHIKVIPAMGGQRYSDIRLDFLRYVIKYRPIFVVPDSTGIGSPIVAQMEQDIAMLSHKGLYVKVEEDGTWVEKWIPPINRLTTQILHNKPNTVHKGFYFDYQSKRELIEYFVRLFQLGLIRIPPEYRDQNTKVFWKETLAFGYDSRNNRIIYGTQREHDDSLIAAALMAYGLKEKPWYTVSPELGGIDNFIL